MRIFEASAFVAAPLGGMTLAQLGADVIRLDPIDGSLDSERWPVADDGQSLYWAGLNKGKRSIRVDLTSPSGRALAAELITAPGDDAGFFLTNLRTLGDLGFESLRSRRADIVMVSIGGDVDGTSQVDYTVNAAVGFPWVTGPEDASAPVNHVLPAWDIAAGTLAAVGLLAADRHRARTGEGRLVEVALSDVAIAMVGHLGRLGAAQLGQPDPPRDGNHLYGAFGHDFVTSDGRWVMVVGLTARQWIALRDATGIAAEAGALESRTGVDLGTEGGRYAARAELVTLLRPWFAARTLDEVGEALGSAKVTWSPYRTFRQLIDEDPRASGANPMLGAIDHPGVGRYLVPASPLRFDGLRGELRRAPIPGEDTDEILAEVLGMSDQRIARLHDQGTVA